MRSAPYAALLLFVLAGCSTPSSENYSAVNVGRPIETSQAAVVSSRVVEISGETNLVGPAAGGIGAAAITSAAINGQAAGPLSLLAGLIGAGAGYAVQKAAGNREGIEYLLKMDDGRTVALVQNREGEEEPLANGTPVLVQRSEGYTRIIADTTIEETPSATWANPDAAAAKPGETAKVAASGESDVRELLDTSSIATRPDNSGQQ